MAEVEEGDIKLPGCETPEGRAARRDALLAVRKAYGESSLVRRFEREMVQEFNCYKDSFIINLLLGIEK